jgi:hypothetical protein
MSSRRTARGEGARLVKRGHIPITRANPGTFAGGFFTSRIYHVTHGWRPKDSQLVANTAKAVETFELAERLAKLEEQTAAKGSTP